MTGSETPSEFQRFSRRLDDEWLRQRVRATVSHEPLDDASLVAALVAADPLADDGERRGWLAALAELLGAWPGRLTLAGAMALLVLAGVLIGRMADLGPERVASTPPVPAYARDGAPRTGLGVAGAIKPESIRTFREAMAFHGTPAFAAKAAPLLRQAVREDPSNDEAQFWLGIVLLVDTRGSEAIPPLEAAMKLAPRNPQYKDYLLLAYLQTGSIRAASRLQTEWLERR